MSLYLIHLRLIQTNKIMIFQSTYSRVMGGQSTTQQLRVRGGTHPGQDTLLLLGTLLPTPTLLEDNVDTRIHLTTSRRHANSTHWPQPVIFWFFLNKIIVKKHWTDQCYSRTHCIGSPQLCSGHRCFFTPSRCQSLKEPSRNPGLQLCRSPWLFGERIKVLFAGKLVALSLYSYTWNLIPLLHRVIRKWVVFK